MECYTIMENGNSQKQSKSNKRSDKSPTNKRKCDTVSNEIVQKFAIFSPESISVIADSIGVCALADDVPMGLSEDVSYKLRELIHNSAVLMRQSKRNKLLVEDVDRVLQVSDAPQLFGHYDPEPPSFVHVSSDDTLEEDFPLFVEEEDEVDLVELALSDCSHWQKGELFVKGMWLTPDEVSEEASSGISSKSAAAPNHAEKSSGSSKTLISAHLLNYYLQLARAIIGGSEPHLQVAVNDLSSNPNIGPLSPFLLNLVALSVNKLPRNAKLTDALLRTVQALVNNEYVDPSSSLAVNRTVNSLLVIATKPKVAKGCDDLQLRRRAAELLTKVLVCWSIERKQQIDTVRQLLQQLLDVNASLRSHYGAVVCLAALGNRTLDSYFWPVMERYFLLLEAKPLSADVHEVRGAILMAAEKMYRKGGSPGESTEDIKRHWKVDQLLYSYYGDMLIPIRHSKSSEPIYPFRKAVTTESDGPITMPYDLEARKWSKRMRHMYTCRLNATIPGKKQPAKCYSLHTVFEIPEVTYSKRAKPFYGLFQSRNVSELSEKPKFKVKPSAFNLLHKKSMFSAVLNSTRCIKYCSPLHKRSSAGDLFAVF